MESLYNLALTSLTTSGLEAAAACLEWVVPFSALDMYPNVEGAGVDYRFVNFLYARDPSAPHLYTT